ncbi:arginine--tRNA ligase [Candidatus Saccharibacteria bacterium]|nr:arginine--tRNA ligase [Candidatus Saccharibacteria bacterium]
MNTLKSLVQAIIQEAFTEEYGSSDSTVQVEYCDLSFGHFTTNIALTSTKELQESPSEIAQKIIARLDKKAEFSHIEMQLPGFINVRLKPEVLLSHLQQIYDDIDGVVGKPGEGKKMIIDYSHPNIGKPMGVHHLLSTVIGDSIKKVYLQLGYEVIADNFVGDLGTQFGKLIHAVKTWGDMATIEKNPVSELLKLYVHFHIEAENDDSLDEAGRAEYKKIEDGDPENRALLKKIQAWSMAEMLALYDELGVSFDYMHGESFYEDKLTGIIDLGKKKQIFTESQGALVCMLDNSDEPPAIIQKKDGTSLYLTRDLARIEFWEQTWHPQLMINVVDVAQNLQLRQVYEVSHKLGLTTAKNIHVSFGRMQFKDGSMSTRKGNIILVEDVIAETKRRVRDQIVSLSKDLSQSQEDELTDLLAINAIKYNILRQNRQSNITFDWDSILSLEGNSAPYLAYTSVRIQAIKRLADEKVSSVNANDLEKSLDAEETELLLQLSRVDTVFLLAEKNFQPSDIANYCYELCRIYNGFYHRHPIITDSGVSQKRLLLNNASLRVLERCFSVLGLKMPEKM